MEFKPLGNSGVNVPVLAMGTWGIGGYETRDETHDQEWIEALKKGIELGMFLIDTAENYGEGHAEELVGEAIKGVGHDIFIDTKVSPNHLSYEDVIKSAEASLKRLKIDCIDLFQIHWPNWNIPISETMRAMEHLVQEGKVKFIGVSNFSVRDMKEAKKVMKREEIVSNQVKYSLLDRGVERDILPYCRQHNMAVLAWASLEKGKVLKVGGRHGATLRRIAEKHGKTVVQVVLNWFISQPDVIPIVKAAKVSHLEENLGALGWRLPEEDLREISEVFGYFACWEPLITEKIGEVGVTR